MRSGQMHMLCSPIPWLVGPWRGAEVPEPCVCSEGLPVALPECSRICLSGGSAAGYRWRVALASHLHAPLEGRGRMGEKTVIKKSVVYVFK